MNLKSKFPLLKLGLSFVIPFMLLIILIPKYFPVIVDQTMTALFAVTSLIMMGIYQLYRKIGHQGNSPMFFGGAILVLAIIPIISSISVQGSIPLIELDARTQGFALIGLAVGFIIFLSGFKSAMNASYFLGRGGMK